MIFSSYFVFQTQVTGRIVIFSDNFERKNRVSFSVMLSLIASPLSNRKSLELDILNVGRLLAREEGYLPTYLLEKEKKRGPDSTG